MVLKSTIRFPPTKQKMLEISQVWKLIEALQLGIYGSHFQNSTQ